MMDDGRDTNLAMRVITGSNEARATKRDAMQRECNAASKKAAVPPRENLAVVSYRCRRSAVPNKEA
jgi:hypothetical protein